MTDLGREILINHCLYWYARAPTRSRQKWWLKHVHKLVNSRPAHVVVWMEMEWGLR